VSPNALRSQFEDEGETPRSRADAALARGGRSAWNDDLDSSRPTPSRTPFNASAYRAEPQAERENPTAHELASLRSEMRLELRRLKLAVSATAQAGNGREIEHEIAAVRASLERLAETTLERDDRAVALLRVRGIEGMAATALLHAARTWGEDADIREVMRGAAASLVRVGGYPLASRARLLVTLVGPTGAGKTTTAAKLAARAMLDQGRRVLLVSCDAFRVGAVEQLRRWAALLGAGFASASNPHELRSILARTDADLVLLDTSGASPSPTGAEGLLYDELTVARERHVLLCMPAATRAVDAGRMMRTFAQLRPTSVAITKLDETDAPAGLLHGSMAANLPISSLCFGQRVPEDVAAANVETVVDYLFPDVSRARGNAARQGNPSLQSNLRDEDAPTSLGRGGRIQ
jgi:flagellar biosynthesis protein FlhF